MYFRYIAASSCCGKTKEKPYNYFIDAPQDEFSKKRKQFSETQISVWKMRSEFSVLSI